DVRLRELGRPRRRGGYHRPGRPRHPGAAGDPAPGVRPRAAPARAIQPLQHLRTRPQPLPVLRAALPARRTEPRPRDPALEGRHVGVGKRRVLVPSLQPHEGRTDARRSRNQAHPGAVPAAVDPVHDRGLQSAPAQGVATLPERRRRGVLEHRADTGVDLQRGWPKWPAAGWPDGWLGDVMRIKQIELTGFKSFKDRTVLELPPGVTAIVGPNGCGKSNVVDAIRWVLGEQSPKHLRGGAMEDVIFAGNGENGPLGMAEASLLMERSEEDLARAAETTDELPAGPESLPPELARAREGLVNRRYFRSGASEYFINKVACRLKDITELFLGTGVGTRAYAIIEQGRVEQIVNAKPEDLRLFLEEAAGITRFRSRRIAAERKMERTRDNLLRVQDVLHELDRQMSSLQRQAKRAEEYHRLKGALRELDLRVMAA